MATRRTIELLPSVFQTDTNRKFLAATLDQLVSEPEFQRLDGYVGRKFSPTYKTSDNYVIENDTNRQNYQVEPSVLLKNSSNEIEFYSNYIDLVNKIGFYGGLTNNHNRLFANEYYTFNGLFDQDKLVNYQQYYWLPNGPLPITISSEFVDNQKTFTFVNDNDDNCLRVVGREDNNPEIVLSRGGLYKFVVNQPGQHIYIQTEPGPGIKSVATNLSTREVYGVTNNGTDNGVIEFRVPLEDAQDVYLKMPYGATVDYSVDIPFSDVDGALWSSIVSRYNGFDNITVTPLEKTIIFTNPSTSDTDWMQSDNTVVPPSLRRGVYKIKVSKNSNNQDVISLNYLNDVKHNNRIYIRLGQLSSNREFYLNNNNQYFQIPYITAQQNILYYQDSTNPNKSGKIRLVNRAFDNINVETSILGKKNYTSPSNIDFTNGMVVFFDNSIEPKKYANKKYVVEGVGRSIRLVEFEDLVFPESGIQTKEIEWDSMQFGTGSFGETYKGPITPDYIVMNRGSLDLNAWSRHNRWFHIDVINKSAELNNEVLIVDQKVRAQRPIIEFQSDLQLFNNGRIGKKPVDHFDTVHTNAFLQVQNRLNLTDNNIVLKEGQRIVFANDNDPLVRSQVYIVKYINQNQQSYQSSYDGQGTGTISIDVATIGFLFNDKPTSLGGPDANGDYSWEWVAQGPVELLSAIRISGLPKNNEFDSGIITNVTAIGNRQYKISFKTSFLLVTNNIDLSKIDIIAPGGTVTVKGSNTNFLNELGVGTELYTDNDVYLGTLSGVMKNNRAQFKMPSTVPVVNSNFWYKKPRVNLEISPDSADALLPYDTLVAKDGANKGKSYWFDGVNWKLAQTKSSVNTPVLFDVFDTKDASFSTYNQSTFKGTKIFSYKVGAGAKDSILGFPISYTSNYSIADITFYHDFSNDVFQYKQNTVDTKQKVQTGYVRQNSNRYDFVKRNSWTTVNELSNQYQIISKTFTGETNYFEIDITGKTPVQKPTIKVFLNNKLLDLTQYRPYVKINKINTVLISSSILNIGDKIDILILSDETSSLGYFQIPTNLEYNSKNESFSNITLGQLRNNLSVVSQGLDKIVGNVPGNSNLRDVDIDGYSGNILQNSAPLIYANLFLIHETSNFINSIEFAKKEYTKFKNKFIELCGNLKGLDIADPVAGVDQVLLAMKNVKNKTFPFYYSDMVPYGQSQNLNYSIINVSQKQYRLQSFFDDSVIQSKAILIYLNNQQLVKGIDYVFDKSSPTVILTDKIIVVPGDVLTIKEYATTDANFIPETPTKLGLYPKFTPYIFNDDTYRESINVIQGHDGSLTPCYNDFRDYFLLELEKRIFNNIKEDPNKKSFDVRSIIPGRFRKTDYSLNEYNSILNISFLKWIGSNKLNYSTNSYFVNGDPFTYNYRETKDTTYDEFLPGYWRGIYQYYYDTDKPHSHPWEMLGFSDQPDWWELEYGPFPYTSENVLLWSDLEQGLIRHGHRQGIDLKYSRPGLSKIIPVDASGDLIPPMIRIATPLNTQTVEQSFVIGDVGPVEAAWRRTSDYPFALQIAAALMKPAIYFGTLIDTNNYHWSDFYNQYHCENTKTRITPDSILINGENVNGVISRTKGYINWIVDYMTSIGIVGPTKLRSIISNLNVQLSYKVAGYVDKKYLTILSEQFSPSSTNDSIIVPDDSYTIHLSKSVPVDRISYSAVIIEKTNTGYAVSGYNLNNPYFIVVPSETSGDKYTVTVEGINAIIYKSFIKEKRFFPYGTEFNTKQQVVDFLVSYQRALIAQGFIFNEYDNELLQVKDWILSVKEFLTWSLQGWKSGSVIILSPVNNTIIVNTTDSVVDQITNTINGSKLLDPNFNAIKTNEITVLRDSGDFKVTSITGKTITFAEFNLVQFEHVLIFENKTIFNDVMYNPETGSRQFRLKLVGNKTSSWDGSLYAPGFVFNDGNIHDWKSNTDYFKGDLVRYKNLYYVAIRNNTSTNQFDFTQWRQITTDEIKKGLLSNFSNNAKKFGDIYDVDSTEIDKQFKKIQSGLIGFRGRSYLDNLNLNQVSQTKFYQGLIKNKGTSQSISNLENVTFGNLTNNVEFYEIWATRVGEYGALTSTSTIELLLNENFSKQNPQGICIDDQYTEPNIITIKNSELFNKSFNNGPVRFINRKSEIQLDTDIQSAGYVNINDIDGVIFDITSYQTSNINVQDIFTGYLLWVGKDYKKDWNVYRATESDIQIEKIEYNLDNVAKVFTKDPHSLLEGTLIVIKNFNSLINGFYVVNNITNLREFTISLTSDQSQSLRGNPILSTGQIFSLRSVRFESAASIDNFTPKFGWRDDDLVWVDNLDHGRWAVFKKYNPWNFSSILSIEEPDQIDNNFGSAVKISKDFLFTSAVGTASGKIYVYNRKTLQQLTVSDLSNQDDIVKGLGRTLDFYDNYLIAGAPDSNSQRGLVIVYRFTDNSKLSMIPTQVISMSEVVGSQFGYCVSLSNDNQWLYVGAPGENKLYVYSLNNYDLKINNFTIDKLDTGCLLPYTITDAKALEVYCQDILLKPNVDFYIENNNTVKFQNIQFNPKATGRISIIRRSFYDLKEEIVGNTFTEFGFSVKTNKSGNLIFVGAPGTSSGTTTIQSGKVYLYKNNLNLNSLSITLSDDQFEMPTAGYRARFGSSIEFASETSSVYIGAPGYSNYSYTGGAVLRYVLVNGYYVLAQEIFKPMSVSSENFGSFIKVSKDDKFLAISSTRGTSKHTSTIDQRKTTFDSKATIFLDITLGTGAVYLYEFMPGRNNTTSFFGTLSAKSSHYNYTTNNANTYIKKNGSKINYSYSRGHTLAVFNEETLILESIVTYDTYGQGSDILLSALQQVQVGKIIVIVSFDATSLNLQTRTYLNYNFGTSDTTVWESSRTAHTVIAQKNTVGVTPYENIHTENSDQPESPVQSQYRKQSLFGNYIFGTEFNAPNMSAGDQFGCSLDFDNNEMYIGAGFNDSFNKNVGAVYLQTNVSGRPIWDIVRRQQPKVDPTSINSISLYNKTTKTKIASLDYIDPVKGKMLGIVEQNIDFKTSRDPALYNNGTQIEDAELINLHWGLQQVGKTWWNLDTVRYFDYEQGELIYRLNNWGRLFPGSEISVYEWVESNVVPSEYVENGEPGIPLHADDSKYVRIDYADQLSGIVRTKYYFWVKGLTQKNENNSKTLSVQGIKYAIEEPIMQSIPYAAILSDRSIGLFNCNQYLTGNDVILKIDYDQTPNSNLVHSEFELIQENNPNSVIPDRIINKLIDSLSGIDSSMRIVPDPLLTQNQKIGLETRPRQTLILNRVEALKNLTKFVNSVFDKLIISEKLQNNKKFEKMRWFNEEPKPTDVDHIAANLKELSYIKLIPGRSILIENNEQYDNLWTLHVVEPDLSLKMIRNQSFRTRSLWKYKNWYKSGYDSSIIPDFVVEHFKDIELLNIVPGNIVQVNKSSTIGHEIYYFNTSLESELIAVENGTLEISDTLWNQAVNETGFDSTSFESMPMERNRSVECRNLLIGLFEDFFVNELEGNKNKLVFSLIKYILSEQKNVDWIFKTSFISILHKIKRLEQFPIYGKDNHEYYEEYINEIKPYSTKIHEYKVSYAGNDIANTAVTDFDLPAYYDKTLNRFRSPNGEIPATDNVLFTKPEYIDWSENSSYGVESITISNGGVGYTQNLQVKIIANGDAGHGATAIALINEVSGTITKVQVTNPGSGYRNTPFVFISGAGTGVRAYAQLSNKKIRSLKTVIKFDRVAYITKVKEWRPNTVYNTNDLVSYQGQGYRAKFTNSSSVFNTGNFTLLKGNDYVSANDRLASTYYPGKNQEEKNVDSNGNISLASLIPGISYKSNVIQSFTDLHNETDLEGPKGYDRFFGTGPYDINVKGGNFIDPITQYAPEELLAGNMKDSLNITVSTIINNPLDLTEQKVVKYRIFKDIIDDPTYTVISSDNIARLAKDLLFNDTEIFLDDISTITIPNPTTRIPGILFINGEKIKFWRVDTARNCILYPIRGADCTSIPPVHIANSTVEDQSPNFNIPDTTTVDWDQHIFTSKEPVFKPFFKVHPDIRVTRTRLRVYNSATLLQEDIDYTLELSQFGGVFITLLQAAHIKDGVKFDASYTTEKSWLNTGVNLPADGTGLNGSVTSSAIFMKRFLHDL